MKTSEVIGIIVLECECGQKFVVNTETAKWCFQYTCSCGRQAVFAIETNLALHLKPVWLDGLDKSCVEYKREIKQAYAMPLDEYKRCLADFVMTGKKPKVNKVHSQVVNFDTNEQQYQSLYETLRQLGYSKNEAATKLDITLKEGLRMETEIIKYILGLQ